MLHALQNVTTPAHLSSAVGISRADQWSDDYVETKVMARLSPGRPLFRTGSTVAAFGSGFSASLRRPPLSRQLKSLTFARLKDVLPVASGECVTPESLHTILEVVLRDKGEDRSSPTFKAKRALRKVDLLVATLSAAPWSDVKSLRQQLTKACRLWRKYATAPLILAIDAAPLFEAGASQSATDAYAARAALRAAIDEMLRDPQVEESKFVFYFPALELTSEFTGIFDDDGLLVHKRISDALVQIFRSYYGEDGPDSGSVGKEFIDTKRRMLRLALKEMGQPPKKDEG